MAKSAQRPTVFDTGKQYLGSVYAKALLGAAGEQAESVLSELDSLIVLLDELPKLDAALGSPRIKHEEKEKILDSAFQKRLSDVLLRFLKVVSRHGRLDCLRAVHFAAHQLYNESCNRVEVHLRTAVAMDAATLDGITSKLETALGQDIIILSEVDESLIGGMVIQIGDTVFDGSLADRLVRLREDTINNTAQIIRDAIERFTLAD